MLESFLIALREGFQCAAVTALVLMYPRARDRYRLSFITGIAGALIIGFSVGYLPFINNLLDKETWTFWRHLTEITIFYLGVAFTVLRPKPMESMVSAALFALGFSVYFFEARALGFLIHDMGLIKENLFGTAAAGAAGAVFCFAPVFFLRFLRKMPPHTFIPSSLLVCIGALKLTFGGVGELEEGSILMSLQNGFLIFLGNAVDHVQYTLLISEHPFIRVPFAGLAGFLSGDRAAMSLTVLFVMAPVLFTLGHIFASPDPALNGIPVAAQKRLKVAFFRKELFDRTFPVFAAFILIFFLIHAVNVSLNPLTEPVPIPVRESEEEGVLKIPLSDKTGDLTDGKLRKYVHYYGNRQIIFLAILKPNGSVGVALDECEVCKPAEWNKAAQGYAQKGDHLICKYCMTPIPVPTVNNPGGCNPIPLRFKLEDEHIVIALKDLIGTYKKAKSLDTKETYL